MKTKAVAFGCAGVAFFLLALGGGWAAWRHSAAPPSVSIDPLTCDNPSLWFRAFLNSPFDAEAFSRRKEEQVSRLKGEAVFSHFHLDDRSDASGITFHHRPQSPDRVDWKNFYYDHFGSVAVADVNGDGYPDLYFTTLHGRNELWLNKGDGTFTLSPFNEALALRDQGSSGASFGDFDNDGLPDLVVATVKHQVHLFQNLGGGRFKEVSENLGALPLRHSSSATFLDFNNDGLLDILVSNVGDFTTDHAYPDGTFEARLPTDLQDRFEAPFLLKNLGNGHFRDVSGEVGLKTRAWTADVLVNDLKGEGFPDIYVLNMHGPNQFFLNDHGKFIESTARYFPRTPFGAMGGKFFDYDNDGRPDLFVTDMHADMLKELSPSDVIAERSKNRPDAASYSFVRSYGGSLVEKKEAVAGNALFRDPAGGKSAELSDALNLESYWPWGASVADVNADGYEDVFITSGMGFPFRYGISSLKLNGAGTRFVDAELGVGAEPARRTSTVYFRLDCDGRDRSHPRCVYCRDPLQVADPSCRDKDEAGRLLLLGATSDRSSAFVDLNNDGALDLVVSQFNGPPRVLISDLARKKKIRWLKVKLVGARSNRDGLGAMVELAMTNGHRQFRWNDGKSGYLSQSSVPLYFGLGEADRVREIRVRWPAGGSSRLEGGKISINSTVEMREP